MPSVEALASAVETDVFVSMLGADGWAALCPDEVIEIHEFGSQVVRAAESADSLYIVVKGTARAVASDGCGAERTVRLYGRGEVFGIESLRDDAAVEHTVRAAEPLTLRRYPTASLHALAIRNATVRARIAVALTRNAIHLALSASPGIAALLIDHIDDLVIADVEDAELILGRGESDTYLVVAGRMAGTNGATYSVGAIIKGGIEAAPVTAVGRGQVMRIPDNLASILPCTERSSVYVVPMIATSEVCAPDESLEAASAERWHGDTPKPNAPRFAVPSDATGARPLWRRRRTRVVRQVDELDCGPAALCMLAAAHGRHVSLAESRRLARTNLEGTSLDGLRTGAEQLGFDARARKVSPSNYRRLLLPAIAHWDDDHWVVVDRVTDRHATLLDPARGRCRCSLDELARRTSGYMLMVRPGPAFAPHKKQRQTLLFSLQPMLAPYRRVYALIAALALVVAGLELALPTITQLVVDGALDRSDRALLDALLIGFALAAVLLAIAGFIQRWLVARVAVRVDSRLLAHVAEHLIRLPMQYFLERRVGDLSRRLVGLRHARELVVQNALILLVATAQLIGALALMVRADILLALAFIAALPVWVAVIVYSMRRIRPLVDGLEDSYGKYASRQIDALTGIETVKARAAERAIEQCLIAQHDSLARLQFRVDITSMAYDAFSRLVGFIVGAGVLWLGAHRVLDHEMSLGAFVSLVALAALATASIWQITAVLNDLQYAGVLAARLEDVFVEAPEPTSGKVSERLHGWIDIEGLTYRPDPDQAPVLNDIHLRVEPGTTVAVVGRSGSGKTTLLRLLAGLIDPSEGRVMYDGVDVREYSLISLRSRLGIVLQDSYVFADSVAANIAFGEATPDRERVQRAASLAGIDTFVRSLPLQYSTRIGDGGLRLSGGQRQRVAIARALYSDPAVLLLDEATSALDTESERGVVQALAANGRIRTTIVVAHRISTVANADLIVVLDRGRIVERGTHAALLDRGGLYHLLASDQL